MSLTLTNPVTPDQFSRRLLEIDGFVDWLVEYGNLDVVLPIVGYFQAEGYQWAALNIWERFIIAGDHIDVRLDGDDTVYIHHEYVGEEDELARIPTVDRLGWLTGIYPTNYPAAIAWLRNPPEGEGADLYGLNTVTEKLGPCRCCLP